MDFKEVFDALYEIEKQKMIDANPGINVNFAFEKKTAQLMAIVFNMISVTGGKVEGLAKLSPLGDPIAILDAADGEGDVVKGKPRKTRDKSGKEENPVNTAGGNDAPDSGKGTD